ncbi:MAG: SH3 domain-containing protein [Bacteroidales bacterium]|jgi:hypothetical protein|nr:SH3 domain-containing protein [Bacteroidales bacterium]
MKNRFLIILFCLTFSINGLFGQFNSFRPFGGTIRVLSTDGVYMRKEPNLNSEILIKIPFTNEIKIDSIAENDTIINKIKGYWVKGKYNNIQGFIFSGYLAYFDYVKADTLNNEFRLQQPGLILFELEKLNYDVNLNWYSLYYDRNKKSFNLNKANIDLNNQADCAYVQIVSSDKNNPKFFIGSKNILDTGFIANDLIDDLDKKIGYNSNLFEFDSCQTLTDLTGLEIQCKIIDKINRNKIIKQIILTKGNKKQILVSDKIYDYLIDLEFFGDLDGDANPDLILNVYNNTGDGSQGGIYYLYLSSKAGDNEFVKMVSNYKWSTGGCD